MNDIDKAKLLLEKENAACAAVCGKNSLLSWDKGIRPLLNWLEADRNSLSGWSVADKIVGRAAAFLFIYADVRAVYGRIMTRGAYLLLTTAKIDTHYGDLCGHILNRTGTDICPMEKAVQEINEPSQAYEALKSAAAGMGGRNIGQSR